MSLEHYSHARLAEIRRLALWLLNNERNETMNDYNDVMNRLLQTKPINSYDPFIGQGEHNLIVHSINEFNDQQYGKSYRGIFLVESSTNPQHPPGSLAARVWNINKPSMYPTQANDADAIVDFICVLQGIQLGQYQAGTKALLVSQSAGGNSEAQPARGARIVASGQPPGQGLTAKGKPKTYVKITWRTVQNDAASIASNRAMLDARYPMNAAQARAPMPQQYAPQGFVQPQQVFAPQAMVQQQPTFSPSVPQATQQAQSYPIQQYQGAIPPAVAPHYGNPQPSPAWGTQPQPTFQATPVQPSQPVQGVPQGGFLAMLPPKQG